MRQVGTPLQCRRVGYEFDLQETCSGYHIDVFINWLRQCAHAPPG